MKSTCIETSIYRSGPCGKPAVFRSYEKSFFTWGLDYVYLCHECIEKGWAKDKFEMINPKLTSML